jgi:kojibiose phosphorylase
MDVILGHEAIRRTNVIKQADVIMAIYLLWNEFSPEVREANFRYYERRTAHGSSLSPSIHALVAARLGDLPLAEKYLRQAAEIDLGNNMGNAAGGVHAAAIGGLWQAMVFGFAGMSPGSEGLTFDPVLLSQWRSLAFPVQWRGRELRLEVEPDHVHMDIKGASSGLKLALSKGEGVWATPPVQLRAERVGDRWEQLHAIVK